MPKARPLPRNHADYIPRPPNMWICFRTARTKEMKERNKTKEKGPRQAIISKQLKTEWDLMPVDEKAYWEELAKRKAEEHKKKYPGYKYHPQRQLKFDYKLSKKVRKSSVASVCDEAEVGGEGEGYYTDSQCSDMQDALPHCLHRRVSTRQIYPIDASPTSYRIQAPFATHYESNSHIDPPLWRTPSHSQRIQTPELINGPLNFYVQNEIPDAASYLQGTDASLYSGFFPLEPIYNPPRPINPMLLHTPVTTYSQFPQGPCDIWEAGTCSGIPAMTWMERQCGDMPIELQSFWSDHPPITICDDITQVTDTSTSFAQAHQLLTAKQEAWTPIRWAESRYITDAMWHRHPLR